MAAKNRRRKPRRKPAPPTAPRVRDPTSHKAATKPDDDELDGTSPDESTSVLELIRGIQSGSIRAQSISVKNRRACVEHLTADGFSVPEIAQVLATSDRTIARDRAEMRMAHSVDPSPELTKQMVGHLLREAEISVNRLRRFARGQDVDVAQKIESEKAAWATTRDMFQTLQRLGYLPSAPTTIQGQLFHQYEAMASPEEMQREIERIEQIMLNNPQMRGDPLTMRMIKQVKSTARALVRSETDPAQALEATQPR